MKNIALTLATLMLVWMTSCGSDEEKEEITINNEITIAETSYDITNAGFVDLGEAGGASQGSFALSDAGITVSETRFSINSSSSIRVIVQLISPGSSSLNAGDYELGDVLDPTASQVFFDTLIEADGTSYTVDSGTVSLSGSSPNFTITFDLTLDGGVKLLGGFNGEFVTN